MALDLSGLAPKTFSQLNFGEYIDQASTYDESRKLSVQSQLKSEGISSFVARFDEHRNSEAGSGDDPLAVYVVCRGNFRAYTPADVHTYVSHLGELLTTPNLVRIFRGER